jgi:hypothetical protein
MTPCQELITPDNYGNVGTTGWLEHRTEPRAQNVVSVSEVQPLTRH